MKKILITGAAGFIGSRVTELLLGNNATVVGIDNFNDYYNPELKKYRIEPLLKNPQFIFRNTDITDDTEMDVLFSHHAPDAVIHLAGMAGIRYSKDHPMEYEKNNIRGTAVVLETMRNHRTPRIIFSSSSSVYAGNKPPFFEDMRTDYPASVYGTTKKSAEMLVQLYSRLYGFHAAILRYFSVYGPKGRPDMSYFRFIRAIEEGRPIEILGDGYQKRDFTYIEDIARGTIKALEVKGFTAINLGGGGAHSVNEMIGLIEKYLSRKSVKIYREIDPSDLEFSEADISRARIMLDWSPSLTFEEGIESTVTWHKANRLLIKGMKIG